MKAGEIMAKCSYGGQAVIEGVMMRGRKTMAVAVRKNSGEIVVTEEKLHPLGEKIPFLKWPLIRGTVALIDSLVIGIRVLTYSANQAVEEEDSEESISPVEMVVSVVLALALGVGIFFLIPVGLAALDVYKRQGNILKG